MDSQYHDHVRHGDTPRPRTFQRPAIEHVNFANPAPLALQQTQGPQPPRPSSSFARANLPRPLSNIREASDSHSEEAGDCTGRGTETARQDASRLLNPRSSTSTLSVPLPNVPERKSSGNHLRRKKSRLSADLPLPLPRGSGQTIPARGQSISPVRSAAVRLNHISSNMRRIPSRTFVRSVKPTDILDVPKLSHPRVSLDMRIAAPLFMGGGTVEGQVLIVIDGGKASSRQASRPTMSIGRISVDVLGVEISQGKQSIFRSLANELIDEAHPPPYPMVAASRAIWDAFWEVAPSTSTLPFRLDLPVYMGPPTYDSKHAHIKYILCTTLAIRISGKHHYVRQSQEIAILTVHDPEKALVNLPNALIAGDELCVSRSGVNEVVKLTAGVHRQTWVAGMAMFVDVHISNSSQKTVKKIELQLEKVTTFYDHAAAATNAEAATHLRLPDRTEKILVATSCVKKARRGWQGVSPQCQDMMTCYLKPPSCLVTIDIGRFFGVRFFVTVIISGSFSKNLKVQIPVTIIHPNSLDIVPNSLAQVAAAIEHKRGHRSPGKTSPYRYNQGRAFTAARRQSYEQIGSKTSPPEDMEDLRRELDGSPRKMCRQRSARASHGLAGSQESNRLTEEDSHTVRLRKTRSSLESRGPRLQRSTSGLMFDDPSSDDGDSFDMSFRPRSVRSKVEGQIQRELSLARKRSKTMDSQGWRNIAAEEAERSRSEGTAWV